MEPIWNDEVAMQALLMVPIGALWSLLVSLVLILPYWLRGEPRQIGREVAFGIFVGWWFLATVALAWFMFRGYWALLGVLAFVAGVSAVARVLVPPGPNRASWVRGCLVPALLASISALTVIVVAVAIGVSWASAEKRRWHAGRSLADLVTPEALAGKTSGGIVVPVSPEDWPRVEGRVIGEVNRTIPAGRYHYFVVEDGDSKRVFAVCLDYDRGAYEGAIIRDRR